MINLRKYAQYFCLITISINSFSQNISAQQANVENVAKNNGEIKKFNIKEFANKYKKHLITAAVVVTSLLTAGGLYAYFRKPSEPANPQNPTPPIIDISDTEPKEPVVELPRNDQADNESEVIEGFVKGFNKDVDPLIGDKFIIQIADKYKIDRPKINPSNFNKKEALEFVNSAIKITKAALQYEPISKDDKKLFEDRLNKLIDIKTYIQRTPYYKPVE